MDTHIFTDSYNETIKVLCQQNSPFCIVKTSSVYSYHWTLKGLNYEMATINDVRKLFYTAWHNFAKNVSPISTLHIWTSRIYSSNNGVMTYAVLSAANMVLIHYLRRIQSPWLSVPVNNTYSLHALLFQERAPIPHTLLVAATLPQAYFILISLLPFNNLMSCFQILFWEVYLHDISFIC
jgi:hypothetical protein